VHSEGLAQAFLDRVSIPGVSFWHNDYVRVVSGTHAGSAGSLVTVLSVSAAGASVCA